MAETVVYVRGDRQTVREAIAAIPKIAAGEVSEAQSAKNALLVRVGLVTLGRIRRAFVIKARGGTDETGLSWPPLSPKTIAYSRRHPGVPKNRSGTRPSWMLSEKQKERWWALYRIGLVRFKGDKASAAKMAWAISKAEGAETLIGKYGATQVEILRDIDLLLNSLSPGIDEESGQEFYGPIQEQVFRIGRGDVIVGTTRKGAASHHYGTAKIPQRRLWPDPQNWTQDWWDDITDAVQDSLIEITLFMLKRGNV